MRVKSNNRLFVAFGAVVAVIALSSILPSCAKTKSLRSMVSPDAYIAKSAFEGKTFSLVRGIEEADSNNSVEAIPGFSEDFGFVEARITKDELQFIEVFNPENKESTRTVLASFPITEHFDIKREENDFREKTNKIIEDREKPWNQRQFMRVDWAHPSNANSRYNKINGGTAIDENMVQLTDPQIDKDGHISWLNEVAMKTENKWSWFVEPASRVYFRTHLMPVKKTDYEKAHYREKDFQRFGYFYTKQFFADPERGFLDSQLDDNTYANLHNVCEPGRKDVNGRPLSCSTNKIVWHLSKGYAEKYKAVTRQAVREWNEAFKAALGRTDDVVVLNEDFEVDMVDPRYNTLAYYGEKSPGGLLGVAQEVINPLTGETIASRATVYEDGIRGTLGFVDSILSLILADEDARQMFLASDQEVKARLSEIFPNLGDFKVHDEGEPIKASNIAERNQQTYASANANAKSAANGEIAKSISRSVSRSMSVNANFSDLRESLKTTLAVSPGQSLLRKKRLMEVAPELFDVSELSRFGGSLYGFDQVFGILGAGRPVQSSLPALGGLENLFDIGSALKEQKARLVNQAETGVHGTELVEDAAIRYIQKVLAKNPNLNDFQAQVAAIKNDVDQLTFYSTLLHEMGHTFGLRHNFQGSADAEHYLPEFYKLQKQLVAEAELPVEQQTVSQADLDPYMYSSIMDYMGDFYGQSGGLGPYDKAAIRYGYNRSIDRENDETTKAGYSFCTDHQVDESILCRRFDKGRNVSEITSNLIQSYQNSWVLSHFRRDRATFNNSARSFPMRLLGQYFVPIRQAMDEYVYALIDSKTVAAGDNECTTQYWKDSIDAGEMVNVCNAVEAEMAGIDPTDLATFFVGLFDKDGFLKNPKTGRPFKSFEYKAYGLADLTFADILVKQFFIEVLGSVEPGMYVALPVSETEINLERIAETGNLDESLAQFAAEHGLPTTSEIIGLLKKHVGKVGMGRYGKPFNSEVDESGPFSKQKNIGAFFDKYVAMVALGLRDIGIEKYYQHSMTGNAYTYPQTKDFVSNLMRAMIMQDQRLAQIPLKTEAGVLMARSQPVLNSDIQTIGTITALVDFVSDQDPSFAERLRICSLDDQGCRAGFGQKSVEFTTASGQDVFRAVQSFDGDSIAFDLVSKAAQADMERKRWVETVRGTSDTAAANLMKVDELQESKSEVIKSLESLNIEGVTKAIPLVFSDQENVESAWNIMKALATQGDQIPLFMAMKLAEKTTRLLYQVLIPIAEEVQKLDPKGQCPVPEETVQKLKPSADEDKVEDGGASPTVIGLKAKKSSALLAGDQVLPEQEKAVPTIDCSKIIGRKTELFYAFNKAMKFAGDEGMGAVLNSVLGVKTAPLRIKRATADIQRAESNIRLIRRISKAIGVN